MLKIKDEVELKELEKFGFKFEFDYFYREIDCLTYQINASDRIICVFTEDLSIAALDDILYDLIQAGFVEKC